MISKQDYEKGRSYLLEMFKKADIAITPDEIERVEVADFNLGDLEQWGLELLTYINTDRVCAKELVLYPGQTCPEHIHPPVLGEPGKEETFRCRWGEIYLYVEGEPTAEIQAKIPAGLEKYFTSRHEIILKPGDQYTLKPNTWHWFQGGPQGGIVSEFSTTSRDELDLFTDPRITRVPIMDK